MMNAIRLLPIALLALTLTACQSSKDEPFITHTPKPIATTPPPVADKNLQVLKELIEKDALKNSIDRENRACPAVYKPVCVVYMHNGQKRYASFNNSCLASGISNVVSMGDGFCE